MLLSFLANMEESIDIFVSSHELSVLRGWAWILHVGTALLPAWSLEVCICVSKLGAQRPA